jgi:protein involved in polysaccharide export with SLBB domain
MPAATLTPSPAATPAEAVPGEPSPAAGTTVAEIAATAGEGGGDADFVDGFFDGSLDVSADSIIKSPVKGIDMQLRRFGFDFFRKAGGFQPDQQALVGPDYVVGPGDVLKIDVWGNIEGNYSVPVDRNGDITLPRVGVIHLWGQSFAQARETINKQISKYFKNFELNVTLGELRSIQVYLVGEVNNPGPYRVSSLATVLTTLSQAGGVTGNGTLRQVQVLRDGELVQTIDFYDFFLAGDKSTDVRLQSGDTIFVPVAGPLVGIAGNVRRPAIYELKTERRLLQVLQLAGGITPTAYLQKVHVERIEANRQKVVLDLDLSPVQTEPSDITAFTLQDRDLVKVSPIVTTGGYVSLKGYVTRPGTYQFTPGMRLADLILPYDNLLPEYFPGLAQIIRYIPPQFRPESLTVDFDKALQGDPVHNILLQEYDEVRLFSRRQMEEIPQVVVSGSVLNPGKYQLFDKMTVKDLVTLAGNVKRTTYLGEAEITRYIPSGLETHNERLLIDLQKALQDDPEHNLVLLPDDHLFIRSIPDSDEKFLVQVQGAVLFPGSYAITKGELLSSVLERAGGFTDKAYLRGAVFTRDSLKAIQRQQLEKLMFEQEQAIYRATAELAAGALDDAAATAAQTTLESRRQLLEKLRQAPVTGRMVVRFVELAAFRGTPSDVEVVSGDSIMIPENPRSVTILGNVYNPTSLAYAPGKTVSYYLSQVGGTKKNAEESEMFIVRANGTVVSKQQTGLGVKWDSEHWRWVFGGFNVTELYPGDAILVPEKVKTIDVMREVKDISTIIYQMALGAAAVASF